MTRKFEANNFNRIYSRYFEDLVSSNSIEADPSGWANTESPVEINISNPKLRFGLANYIIDNRRLISPEKEVLVELISRWDESRYLFDQVTLMPSISAASLAVLQLLRRQGVEMIYFETPAYYATLDQAALVGIRQKRIPSYFADAYDWDLSFIKSAKRPIAVWLTQPRFSLGMNQSLSKVAAICELVLPNGFVVVDETADQLWPTSLARLSVADGFERLVKIRGYMKPLGLNALRMAFILHAACWRADLREAQWIVGGALDYLSLAASVEMAKSHSTFKSMLGAARRQVVSLHRRISSLLSSPYLGLSDMANGYLGTARIHWDSFSGSRALKRATLLSRCRTRRMPITLASSMLFAADSSCEHVRLNYFMPARDLEYFAECARGYVADYS